MKPSRVLVVGSANVDYIVRVPRFPTPGQTILTSELSQHSGGKGANQAVAAARLGAEVSFVGCVGDDPDGRALLAQLEAEGIDTRGVECVTRARTGLAIVSIDDAGQNSIIVAPGANFLLHPDAPQKALRALSSPLLSRVIVVTQGEISAETVENCLREAEAHGARAVLNLAPFRPMAESQLRSCDPLILNEDEAGALVGRRVSGVGDAQRAALEIKALCRSVVVTIGADGAFWADAHENGLIPAPRVEDVVDTTGAGDAFVGAVVASLAQGEALRDAVRLGVLAGSYSVRGIGAQTSYARLGELRVS